MRGARNPKRREADEYLTRIKDIPFILSAKQEQIKQWRELGYTAEQIEPLTRDDEKLRADFSEAVALIHRLSEINGKYAIVLEMRYIRGLKIADIADRMGYVTDWVDRFMNKALDEFGKIMEINK